MLQDLSVNEPPGIWLFLTMLNLAWSRRLGDVWALTLQLCMLLSGEVERRTHKGQAFPGGCGSLLVEPSMFCLCGIRIGSCCIIWELGWSPQRPT